VDAYANAGEWRIVAYVRWTRGGESTAGERQGNWGLATSFTGAGRWGERKSTGCAVRGLPVTPLAGGVASGLR